jgi:uncharacterized protein (DUF1499 family)
MPSKRRVCCPSLIPAWEASRPLARRLESNLKRSGEEHMKKTCLAILFCLGLASCSVATARGLEDGRLRPCPKSPNCVSTESPVPDLEPFAPAGEDGWERLRRVIVSRGGRIEAEDADYMHATFRSRVFGFVDDLECRLDGGVIQVRSASRTGWWDLGANRRRVERLREAWSVEAGR